MDTTKAILYHGTNAEEFDRFDPACSKTAMHIYTTPDRTGAEFFGRNVLTFTADMHKAIDLSDPYEKTTYTILKDVYEEMTRYNSYDSLEHFIEAYMDGRLYQDAASSDFQDELLEAVFSLGYDPVIIPDQLGAGRIGTAVVFDNPDLLTRINTASVPDHGNPKTAPNNIKENISWQHS